MLLFAALEEEWSTCVTLETLLLFALERVGDNEGCLFCSRFPALALEVEEILPFFPCLVEDREEDKEAEEERDFSWSPMNKQYNT